MPVMYVIVTTWEKQKGTLKLILIFYLIQYIQTILILMYNQ